MTSRNGNNRLQTLLPTSLGVATSSTLQPDRFGVAQWLPVLLQPQVDDPRLPAIEHLPEPEVGDLAGLVHAVIRDPDLELRLTTELLGQVAGYDQRGRRLATVERLLAPGGLAPRTGGRLQPHHETLGVGRTVEQRRVETISLRIQEWRALRQVLGADHHDDPGLLLQRRGELHHAVSQQRIQQDGQHEDHEQGATVADLVSHLAAEDHTDIGPSHRVLA